jgi:hypothetical protein
MEEQSTTSFVSSWLWNEHFWLPENISWSDLESHNGIQYPQFHELGYSLLVAFALTILRILVEALVFLPIGYMSGWMDPRKV